jgi:hypothetical protein
MYDMSYTNQKLKNLIFSYRHWQFYHNVTHTVLYKYGQCSYHFLSYYITTKNSIKQRDYVNTMFMPEF